MFPTRWQVLDSYKELWLRHGEVPQKLERPEALLEWD